jgi:hypothetical protein
VASVLSWILTAVALIALLDYMMPHGVATGLELLSVAVECAMMWFLLGGVMELAAARQRVDLSERGSQCRVAYGPIASGVGTI